MSQQQQPQSVKKSSFQITSVTVDSSVSNDGGDDSADDLDESHTEDSDIATDTSRHPSESRGMGTEDNFTRNDVFFNSAPLSSMGSAPVIPTSSQYGLAIVSTPGTGEVLTSGNPPPIVSMNLPLSPEAATTETQLISSSVPSTADKHEAERDHVHNRFKVVKIVSTEPLKKGRWTCMDYLDHTTTTSNSGTSAPSKDSPASQQPQSQQALQQQNLPHGSPPHQHHQTIQQQQQGDIIHQQQQGLPLPNASSPPQQVPNISGTASHLNDTQQGNMLQAQALQQQIQQQHNVQIIPQSELPQHPVPVDNSINLNGLNNGNSYLQMNHNIGVSSHNQNVHNVNNMNMNQNQNMVSSTNIPNVAVYQTAPHQPQQQYYANPTVVQGNMGPKQGYSTQAQVITTNQAAGQHQAQQQPYSHQQQMPNHEVGASTNPSITPQNSQNQVHQQQQLPGQSLPHGSVMQMTTNAMGSNSGGSQQQQQQQPHTAQSLGHNLMQQSNVPTFLPSVQQQQQPQIQQGPSQFSQQQQTQQQAPQQLMPQQQINIQQQPSQAQHSNQSQQQQVNYQQQQGNNMMMTGIPNIHQQHHMQMNSNQVPMQMQVPQGQPGTQNQAMYSQQPQIHHQMQMTGQQQLPLSGQQQILPQQQPQQMMQAQPQYTNQHSQPMVSQQQQQPSQQGQMIPMNPHQVQGQSSQQQNLLQSQQMAPQVMQNSQMNNLGSQPQMVNMQPQPQHISNQQQYDIQSMQAQNAYQTQQSQPQNTMGNMPQAVIHQQQYQQPQAGVVQQPIMTPQMNQISSGQGVQHMQSQMPQQNQPSISQHSQAPISVPQQQMNMNQQQPMQMYQNQPQPISSNSANIIPSMSKSTPTTQKGVPSSSSNQMGQFPLGTNSGGEITMPVSSNDHSSVQQHSQVSHQQPQQPPPVDSHLGNVSQTQSQSSISQAQPPSTTSSQASLPIVHSNTAPGGDGAAVHATHTSNPAKTEEINNSATNDDGDSASGTNTVAIDNKIEQAMDLVKSHLMFAVREEVEVLKEKISELMERITQLEHENTILRANASQETLSQIMQQQSTTTSTSKPATNSNCANANS